MNLKVMENNWKMSLYFSLKILNYKLLFVLTAEHAHEEIQHDIMPMILKVYQLCPIAVMGVQ